MSSTCNNDCPDASYLHNTVNLTFKNDSSGAYADLYQLGYDSVVFEEISDDVVAGGTWNVIELRLCLDVNRDENTFVFYNNGVAKDSLVFNFSPDMEHFSDDCGFQITANDLTVSSSPNFITGDLIKEIELEKHATHYELTVRK